MVQLENTVSDSFKDWSLRILSVLTDLGHLDEPSTRQVCDLRRLLNLTGPKQYFSMFFNDINFISAFQKHSQSDNYTLQIANKNIPLDGFHYYAT